MKINFVYNPANYFLSDNYKDNLFYDFFMKELPKHCEVTYIPEQNKIDCTSLPKADALLFYSAHLKFTPRLLNIRKVKTPKFMMSGDCHNFHTQRNLIHEYDIKKYWFTNTKEYFDKYFDGPGYDYRQIVIGVDPDRFVKNQAKYKDVVLNTGVLSPSNHYVLRRMCNKVKGVRYVSPDQGFFGDKFYQLLSQYSAAISASTQCFTLRCLEVAFAGCVPFIEVNGINGAESLGFVDGETAVFINSDNYQEKINEYLESFNDRKWEDIANNAHDFVMQNYQVSHGVQKLLQYIGEQV